MLPRFTSRSSMLVLLTGIWAIALVSSGTAEEPAKKYDSVEILFDGKSLGKWQRGDFGKEGTVEVKDGQLLIGRGSPMNGIVWRGGELPKSNYEIVMEAQRVEGADFFATVTFPVKDSACSLVLGGWGGGLIGLSSLNGIDASENETLGYYEFKNGQWYQIRIQVLDDRILCWIDDKEIVNVDISDKEIGIRIEMEFCRPLGVASYRTTGAVRKLTLQRLTAKKS